jgi:uncharacterized protein with NRDE domain
MCLIAIALNRHPKWPVVITANRDEFFDRPTRSAHWWDESFFGGRDLQAGGAWMAVRSDGSFAAVTNVRVPSSTDANAPQAKTRGAIVPAAMGGATSLELMAIIEQSSLCNFIGGALWPTIDLSFQTNRAGQENSVLLELGKVHTVSNGCLNDPWPKSAKLAVALDQLLTSDQDVHGIEARCFNLLSDTQVAPDSELPSTGVPLDWERVLSSAFITLEKQTDKPSCDTHFLRSYGTRSSTVICLSDRGLLSFCERTWAIDGFDSAQRRRYTEKRTQFQVNN